MHRSENPDPAAPSSAVRTREKRRAALAVGVPTISIAVVLSTLAFGSPAASARVLAPAACVNAVRPDATPGCGSSSATASATASASASASATASSSLSPLPTPSATDSTVAGVSVGSDGWISYTDGQATALGVTGSTVTTIDGTVDADGACNFDESATSTAAGSTYQEEVGFNPTTCQDRILTGSITTAAEATLVSPDDTNTVAESPQTATDTEAAGDAVSALAPPYDTAGTAQTDGADASTTHYSSAHTKTSWIDPVNITITSLTTNLRWPLYGAGGSLTGRNNAYKFKYDGWSTSGTPSPVLSAVSGGWTTSAAETFKNNDFEYYVLATFGIAGWAACGYSTATAVFKHSVHVYGYKSGGYGYSWYDTRSGGCSNLVHHRDSVGYGWTS
ncbi:MULTISPECIES: hypothetical protein [Streptacidiphilus]|uniref:Uncharacterized protein n=1 Tax=Streptacidiphilus cavernicola TaxID=3342716 RepID=A0ABV6UUJ3_9ACTN|nr:hypothetical protein [Streptacidiphilus jeojiense]